MRDDPLAGWFPDDAEPTVGGPAADQEDKEPEPEPAQPASASWLEGGGPDDDAAPASRRRLVALATIPWFVAVVLAWALVAGGDDRPDAATQAPPHTAPPSGVAPGARDGAPVTGGPGLAARAGPDLAARAALWTRELVTGQVDGDTMRYVDLAVTEQVFLEGAIAIAIVGAYVLEGSAERWEAGRVDRFALALHPEDGSHLAGPWPVGTLEATTEAASWGAEDRDAEAVERALTAAGYADVELDEVAASVELPGLIRVQARGRGPGARGLETHELLLRDSDPPELLGLAAPPTPQPDPTPEDTP